MQTSVKVITKQNFSSTRFPGDPCALLGSMTETKPYITGPCKTYLQSTYHAPNAWATWDLRHGHCPCGSPQPGPPSRLELHAFTTYGACANTETLTCCWDRILEKHKHAGKKLQQEGKVSQHRCLNLVFMDKWTVSKGKTEGAAWARHSVQR